MRKSVWVADKVWMDEPGSPSFLESWAMKIRPLVIGLGPWMLERTVKWQRGLVFGWCCRDPLPPLVGCASRTFSIGRTQALRGLICFLQFIDQPLSLKLRTTNLIILNASATTTHLAVVPWQTPPTWEPLPVTPAVAQPRIAIRCLLLRPPRRYLLCRWPII